MIGTSEILFSSSVIFMRFKNPHRACVLYDLDNDYNDGYLSSLTMDINNSLKYIFSINTMKLNRILTQQE